MPAPQPTAICTAGRPSIDRNPGLSRRTIFRTFAAVTMLLLLSVLQIWQHVRYELVSDCLERGGTWDGPESRCKLIPPIYLERGIKRSDGLESEATRGLLHAQKRSIR